MSDSGASRLEPFDFVLFGATGDLSMRKLLPALYFRHCEGQIPDEARIICAARSQLTTPEFIVRVTAEALPNIKKNDLVDAHWQTFLQRITYLSIDATVTSQYQSLADLLLGYEDRIRVFYLSTSPGIFAETCRQIKAAGLVTPKSRVALEKPLGRDLQSAELINDELANAFSESQVYRIDHYLGKETVQNLLALRFGNVLFEPLWRRERIKDVQITISESLGVDGRGDFYDKTGALRDMVQNHLLQLLVILAMEPPASSNPDAVRDEKIKVLRALKPLQGKEVLKNTVRGQYTAGALDDSPVPGYREADDIPDDSTTETFVAIRAEIESWRWKGIPFYLRTGKRMEQKVTEIVVNFRSVPHSIFKTVGESNTPNRLIIRLQPDQNIRLRISVKAWGDHMHLEPVFLDLDFNETFGKRQLIAYERLLIDIVRGNPTWFMRRDEVAAAWQWIDPIRQAWDESDQRPDPYMSGSWGPSSADVLISQDDMTWANND